MKKTVFLALFFLFYIFISTHIYSEKIIDLSLKKALEIGKGELIFSSITSVYEDRENNFY